MENIYVYAINHEDKLFYYNSSFSDGDLLVSDINDARNFTEDDIKDFNIDSVFIIGSEIYCEELCEYIEINSNFKKIKLNDSSNIDCNL